MYSTAGLIMRPLRSNLVNGTPGAVHVHRQSASVRHHPAVVLAIAGRNMSTSMCVRTRSLAS